MTKNQKVHTLHLLYALERKVHNSVEKKKFGQICLILYPKCAFSLPIGGYTPISLISFASAAFFPVASSHFLMAAFIVVGIVFLPLSLK